MLKVKLISDLHVDTQKDFGKSLINSIPSDDHDVTVVAGDLCEASDTDQYFDAVALLADHFKQVLIIPGNHEYWGGQAQAVDMSIDETVGSFNNVSRLKPGFSEKISGVNFWGGTLFFDDTPGWEKYRGHFPDFTRIGNFVPWVFEQHQKFVKMFEDNLVQPGDVVVSHHLPSFNCVQPMWKGDPLNRFFATNMDKYITKYQPGHWLFGQTHDRIDMMLDKTRALCNPFGYRMEHSNAKFNDKLVINVGE